MDNSDPSSAAARYRNDNSGSGGPVVGELVTRDSFFRLTDGTLTVDFNNTGQTVSEATIYVQTIELTVGGKTQVSQFSNFDFILTGIPGPALGDIRISSVVGTGFPDTIDTVPSINFGFGQRSVTGTIFPTIVSIAPDQVTLQLYNVTAGNNQRGQVQRVTYY